MARDAMPPRGRFASCSRAKKHGNWTAKSCFRPNPSPSFRPRMCCSSLATRGRGMSAEAQKAGFSNRFFHHQKRPAKGNRASGLFHGFKGIVKRPTAGLYIEVRQRVGGKGEPQFKSLSSSCSSGFNAGLPSGAGFAARRLSESRTVSAESCGPHPQLSCLAFAGADDISSPS